MVENFEPKHCPAIGNLSRNLYSDPNLNPHSRATSQAPPPPQKNRHQFLTDIKLFLFSLSLNVHIHFSLQNVEDLNVIYALQS